MVKMLDLTNWLRRQPRDGVLLIGTPAGWQEPENVVLSERGGPPDPKGLSLMVVQQRFIADIVAKPLKGDELEGPSPENVLPATPADLSGPLAVAMDEEVKQAIERGGITGTPAEPTDFDAAMRAHNAAALEAEPPRKRGRPKSDR
jgi:hypothetical protein